MFHLQVKLIRGYDKGITILLVVKNFQGVDLTFSLDSDIFIFSTEYSRYHLRELILDKSFA